MLGDFVLVGGEALHRLELEPADDGWPCAALIDELGNAAFEAPDCLGVVEWPERKRSQRLVWCSDYCGEVARLVRYRRRVEQEGRHLRVPDGEDVRTVLWRRESDLLVGKFYQPHLTREQRTEVFTSKGSSCVVCGRPATDVDHIVPGGGDDAKNLQPLCASCHLEKTADQGGRYAPVPKSVANTSDAHLRQAIGDVLFERAKESGIGMFALASTIHVSRYASYIGRVYADPSRPCDDEKTWGQVERSLRRDRRAEMSW